jgi:predicted CoA-substrate-specific enzyme activase
MELKMSCYVGIDVGAVSATAAVFVDTDSQGSANHAAALAKAGFEPCQTPSGRELYISTYCRTRGMPVGSATELLEQAIAAVGQENISGVCLTGSGSKLVAGALSTATVNEFKAVAAGLALLGVDVRTVFEMGGESSKYLRLTRNEDGGYGIVDYATNGDCAAGTGSFIDQQANRLQYAVEDVAPIVMEAERAAQVAGRCSVFAKSDMIHAQQKGYSPSEVLRGLCDAVARNFRTAVVRSHPVEAPVAFVGGVASNAAVVRAMREAFELGEEDMFVPQAHTHVLAIGAAAIASQGSKKAADLSQMSELRQASDSAHGTFPTQSPLSMDKVLCLRDQVSKYEPSFGEEKIDVYLGIDIGSVSTNVVAITDQGQVVHEIYTRTQGRPIEVVTGALAEIQQEWGDRLNVCGVGTTGSGRELVGQLVGADTINDEITAHKTGATFIGQTMLDGRTPDTIFEIGGQDSKFISLQDGVVVDFTMNEACAAGTGSFLEERAEELDIAIKGEFAELALSSEAPIRLGERCTVFMERDVNSYLQRGASKPDLVAGLAYSVVYNYINRVVRGRHIGDCVFFQGGTAYNDATAAAFAAVTGKEIIVPPHNGVMGAVGSALLARDRMNSPVAAPRDEKLGSYVSELRQASKFRGYDLSKVDYGLREFTCKGCSNHCAIQEFTVEGEKTYWGDKCSDRFRKQVKSDQTASIDDLMSLREQLLMDESHLPAVANDAPTVGIPMTMFAMEWLPFWRTLLAGCGYRTVLSDPTNKKIITAGLETVVAEPCFPIIVAHGHVVQLAQRDDVDYILLPNIISMETQWMDTESHLCPWHQTLPFVCRQAPALMDSAHKFLTPTVRFREGRATVSKVLSTFFATKGVSKGTTRRATSAAFDAQDRFFSQVRQAGRRALDQLIASGETGIVLVGRPYNTHDAGVNLSIGQKLRDYYGVNVIPLDCIDLEDEDVRDVNDSMFWSLGRRVLAGAKLVRRHDNLHIIYLTNFKCGPDSFIKHFVKRASGKPFLSLQFDGHSNDAGMMTRCEAYLDSKGVLRPWRREEMAATTA